MAKHESQLLGRRKPGLVRAKRGARLDLLEGAEEVALKITIVAADLARGALALGHGSPSTRDLHRLATGRHASKHPRRRASRILGKPFRKSQRNDRAGGEKRMHASSSMPMRILVTGVSGFVGAALLPRLLDEHHEVCALARDPTRVERALEPLDGPTVEEFELIVGDALSSTSLNHAMRDVEVAYYLIHSMEPKLDDVAHDLPSAVSLQPGFAMRERLAAERFAAAARAAGVRRIVYLGGLQPATDTASPHLASRRAVERILLEATDDSLALRASIVIGARSRSFRFLVRLIERLPVLLLPAWRRFRTQPIDERDVIDMLLAAATVTLPDSRSLDIGGPELLSYGEIVQRIADLMLLDRPVLGVDVNVTPIAARLASVIADENPELIVPLMESLTCDLIPAKRNAAEVLGVMLHSFDSAVEHALYEWEKVEKLAAR